jgi:hypothetical protein
VTGETRCRVCGLRQAEAIWGPDGRNPTFAVCACCGCTFGREDASPQSIRAYRAQWRSAGTSWADESKRPADWRIEDQLARLPRFTFRILPSLRGAGPGQVPFRFAGTNAFEGLAVEFTGIGGGEWVGNFQRAIGSKDAVLFAPLRTDQAIVVAGGMVYVVELDTHALVRSFGGAVNELFYLPSREHVIFGNGLWFECEDADGIVWKTPRLSWDGTEDVRLEGSFLRGKAFDVNDKAWCPFAVNIDNGEVEGGARAP